MLNNPFFFWLSNSTFQQLNNGLHITLFQISFPFCQKRKVQLGGPKEKANVSLSRVIIQNEAWLVSL